MPRNPLMLFDPNPPDAEADIEALFHNRTREKNEAIASLTAPSLPALPLVVHGPSRSGKSHFTRFLVQQVVRDGAPFTPLVVAAGEKMSVRRVLTRMYRRLLAAMPDFPPGYTDDALASWQHELQEFHEVLPLIEDASKTVEFEVTHLEAKQRQSRLGFSVAPSITLKSSTAAPGTHEIEPKVDAKFEATRGHDQSHSEARKTKVTVSLRTDEHVILWIDRLLTFHRRVDGQRRVLFVVDDLDLLDPETENAAVCGALLDQLTELTRMANCVVIVTARTRAYHERGKDLPLLANIRAWNDVGELRKVYDLRVARLNDGEPVFADEAIEWLSQRVEGRVGMLLQLCRELSAGVDRPISRNTVLARLKEQVEDWRGRAEFTLVIPRVIRAVKVDKRMQVEFEEALPPNELQFRLLTKVIGAKTPTYVISPLYKQALDELEP